MRSGRNLSFSRGARLVHARGKGSARHGFPWARRRGSVLAALAISLAAAVEFAVFAGPAAAREAPRYYVRDGALLVVESGEVEESGAREPAAAAPAARRVEGAPRIYQLCGVAPDGRAIVTTGKPQIDDGYVVRRGVDLALLAADGQTSEILLENIWRAYASPSGTAVAVVNLDYTLSLWRAGVARDLPVPGRVAMAVWAPAEDRLLLTVYPGDWSPDRANNAPNNEEFLRLINCDLWLYDLAADRAERLTDHPDYDYGGVFSPGGREVVFISGRRAERMGHYLLNLDTREIRPLAADEASEPPIGRSQTYRWAGGPDWIVYEADGADHAPEARAFRASGGGAVRLGAGSQPRPLRAPEGAAAPVIEYLGPEGRVHTATLETPAP